jgi:aspartate aminotransferase-like enzyme
MTEITKSISHLLPGPVALDERVRAEFSKPPVSHRSDEFLADLQVLKSLLCRFVNSRFVEVLSGSGTLANEAVAAQISQLGSKGLILSNGEFGERLVSQANRINLDFITLSVDWGMAYSYQEITSLLDIHPEINWIWTVHCETSTGVLNDFHQLSAIAMNRNIKLCLDCISSIGTMPVDLSNVYLASSSSGKALCSFPGLAMVFYNHEIQESAHIPKYLDLGFYRKESGVPFTLASNLVYALQRAMESLSNATDFFSSIKLNSLTIKEVMLNAGLNVINEHGCTSPALVTIEMPDDISSVAFGDQLEKEGCLVSYKSNYPIRRNWVQTFVTRNTTKEEVAHFVHVMDLLLDHFESHLVTGL